VAQATTSTPTPGTPSTSVGRTWPGYPRSWPGSPHCRRRCCTDWLDAAARLISAYLDTNPLAVAEDVRACARVALLQLLTSLYGVKQHYLRPGLLQDDLDVFWHLRHRTARTLLTRLGEIEDALTDLAEAHTRAAPR
jgi:hypothetical protein